MTTVSSAALSLPVSIPPPTPLHPAVKISEWRSLSNTSHKDQFKVKIQRNGPQRVDPGLAACGRPLLHLLNSKVRSVASPSLDPVLNSDVELPGNLTLTSWFIAVCQLVVLSSGQAKGLPGIGLVDLALRKVKS